MHYVLDTGFFIVTRDYYPDTFPTFWEKMDNAVSSNLISSVSEVKKELEKYGGEQEHLMSWTTEHKNIFTKPSIAEQEQVRNIFQIQDFQNLMEKRTIFMGGPFADPFVIAKAMMMEDGVVVTREEHAKRDKNKKIQGSPKIPDVCQYFEVKCILPREFMRREQWSF